MSPALVQFYPFSLTTAGLQGLSRRGKAEAGISPRSVGKSRRRPGLGARGAAGVQGRMSMSFSGLSCPRFSLLPRPRVGPLAFALAVFRPGRAAAKKTDKKEEAAKPSLVASFGDWNVFVGQAGKGRICYTLAQPKTREPSTSSAIRAMPSSPTDLRRACATKSRSSWVSTSPPGRKPRRRPTRNPTSSPMRSQKSPQRNRRSRLENESEIDRRAGRRSRPSGLRPAAEGRRPLGQERGARERTDHGDEEGLDPGGPGRLAQRQRLDGLLFALRFLASDGAPAEGDARRGPRRSVSIPGRRLSVCRD